jgi:type VI secretion system secreted protein VgrG
MADFSERAPNASLYFFETAQLADDTFQVVRFEGTEKISQPFEFKIQLISKDPDIDFSKVVDKPATFTMMRGDREAPVHGIVTKLSLHGRTADHVVYRATLRPRLWRLGLSSRSRIFQEMKVEEILREVFTEDGLPSSAFRFKLEESYSPREYCVQYQETDLDFVNRLMEFEGIYYFFDHGGGEETLVVTDDKSQHKKIASPSSISYYTGAEGLDRKEEIFRQFKSQEQVVTGEVKLKDYNYRTADTLRAKSKVDDDMPGIRYEYGEHYRDTERGERLARVRNEEIEVEHHTVESESDCMGLRSGHLFTLRNHFRSSLNQNYLVTGVEHEGSQRAGLDLGSASESEEATYRNSVSCIPASVQYRPPRDTPKPEVSGVLTAQIESAGGDYAYIDDQGQYRAEMHFDEREDRSEGTKTLPIRMAQPYSGPDYGMHFPNHPGTEVILAFENGDIDRPVALGTSPNAANPSPATSKNKTQNLIRTHAGNEVLIDDQEAETKIRLTTTGGHEAKLHDGNSGIKFETSGGHLLNMDDDDGYISLISKGGHSLFIDDSKSGSFEEGKSNADEGLLLETRSGHSIEIDDHDNIINLETVGGHEIGLSDDEQVVTMMSADGHVINLDDNHNALSLGKSNQYISIDDSKDEIRLNADKKTKLECGDASITLKKSGKVEIEGDPVKLKTPKGQAATLKDGPGTIKASDINGNTVKMSPSGVTIQSASKVSIKAGASVSVKAASATFSAAMTSFSGVVQASTVTTSSVVSSSYTPGAGNIM